MDRSSSLIRASCKAACLHSITPCNIFGASLANAECYLGNTDNTGEVVVARTGPEEMYEAKGRSIKKLRGNVLQLQFLKGKYLVAFSGTNGVRMNEVVPLGAETPPLPACYGSAPMPYPETVANLMGGRLKGGDIIGCGGKYARLRLCTTVFRACLSVCLVVERQNSASRSISPAGSGIARPTWTLRPTPRATTATRSGDSS